MDTLELVVQWMTHLRTSPTPRTFEEHWNRWIEYRRHYEDFTKALVAKLTESPIEAILYLHLRDWMIRLPLTVEPQVRIGKCRVDFLITTNDKKVVVECDGHDFHEKTKQQARRDKQRDRELTKQGYTVLRFAGSEIWESYEKVISDIEDVLFPYKE